MYKETLQKRLTEIECEREHLIALLDKSGALMSDDVSKSDRCRHTIRELIRQPKAWHITEIEQEVGLDDVKGVIHQVLNDLRKNGEVIAIRINGSNQKYYYMSSKAKSGTSIRDEYLPMPKRYVSKVEIM